MSSDSNLTVTSIPLDTNIPPYQTMVTPTEENNLPSIFKGKMAEWERNAEKAHTEYSKNHWLEKIADFKKHFANKPVDNTAYIIRTINNALRKLRVLANLFFELIHPAVYAFNYSHFNRVSKERFEEIQKYGLARDEEEEKYELAKKEFDNYIYPENLINFFFPDNLFDNKKTEFSYDDAIKNDESLKEVSEFDYEETRKLLKDNSSKFKPGDKTPEYDEIAKSVALSQPMTSKHILRDNLRNRLILLHFNDLRKKICTSPSITYWEQKIYRWRFQEEAFEKMLQNESQIVKMERMFFYTEYDQIDGVIISPNNGSESIWDNKTIIYAAGNYQSMEHNVGIMKDLARKYNVNVVLYNPPGVMYSDETPNTTHSTVEAQKAVFNGISAKYNGDNKKIAVMGLSLGGGITAEALGDLADNENFKTPAIYINYQSFSSLPRAAAGIVKDEVEGTIPINNKLLALVGYVVKKAINFFRYGNLDSANILRNKHLADQVFVVYTKNDDLMKHCHLYDRLKKWDNQSILADKNINLKRKNIQLINDKSTDHGDISALFEEPSNSAVCGLQIALLEWSYGQDSQDSILRGLRALREILIKEEAK